MLDTNKHKFFLVQILKEIYSDPLLANSLGFKGGTALMLFYDLPRFSVDLDFNLLDTTNSETIFNKLKEILQKHGVIKDSASKHFGLLLVLNYGEHERNLKLEVSNRQYKDNYEIKDFLGINIKVMVDSDMFAHKLCALLDRNMLTSRDIFDCHFFMNRRTAINKAIVEARTGVSFKEYLEKCIKKIETVSDARMLSGFGDLMDAEQKKFVKTKLKSEAISLLKIYKDFPLFVQ